MVEINADSKVSLMYTISFSVRIAAAGCIYNTEGEGAGRLASFPGLGMRLTLLYLGYGELSLTVATHPLPLLFLPEQSCAKVNRSSPLTVNVWI